MPKVDDVARMCHMLEAARKALRFAQGKNQTDLEQDEVLQLALVRLLEIVGEAAARVSQETQRRHDQIPWAKIIGMRNRLVHGYDNIDVEVLWQTLAQDLQRLVDQLERILPADGSG